VSVEVLDLLDWKRRVFELYRTVRLNDDPASAWDHWRAERDRLFKHHRQSPIPVNGRADFTGLSYFEYEPAFRALAEVEPLEPQSIELPASEGSMHLERFGRASFELAGKRLSLDVFWFLTYGGGLFVSFRDSTSGKLTYGGCRYLLDTVKGADLGMQDEKLVLDFNFAYQPSCAYDPRWVCPLAPPGNRLDVEVRAGERWTKRSNEIMLSG
jgi:uncharacterized protein (DUF1684 family)